MNIQDSIIFFMEILGTIAFAASGAMVGIRKRMDIFGICVLGVVTAVGGGMTRDVILGKLPSALEKPVYVGVSVATALAIFILLYIKQDLLSGRLGTFYDKAMLGMDSVGLGIFTSLGVMSGIDNGYPDNTFLLVFIGMLTGVGGGVVLGGRLLTGYTGAAAEPGHMVILDTPDAPRCTCGRPGCLESLASATALIRMTKEAMAAHPESTLHGIAAQSGGVNGRTAFDAAARGDAAGKAVVEQYIHYLAVGVANMINIFFPEVIGLSGGVANQGENLLAPLRAAVGPMVFGNAYAQKHTRITTCTLGYRAGVIGAALLAKNQG